MGQLVNILVNILAYSDGAASNNPRLKDIDYSRQFLGISTGNSFDRRIDIDPSDTLQIALTARSLTQDATTEYQIYDQGNNKFRWLFAGGTNPTLRTQRTLTYSALTEFDVTKVGDVVRYTWNGTGADPNFLTNGVIEGDIFHVESDGNFNSLNEGSFQIVGVTDDYVEILNSNGVQETGIAVGPNIGDFIPLDYFSRDGVQVNDQVQITSSAFNIENRGVFNILAVTSRYFEISNGSPGIPEGPTAIGAANAIVFYPDIFKLCYIESNQKISVRLNGDTSDNVEIEPIKSNDPQKVGVFLLRGPVFQLDIANNGSQTASVKVALLE